MAEAVFSLAANITPQLDERALQQQAQLMAKQLNAQLSGAIQPVGLKAETGSFNTFKNQVDGIVKSTNLFDRAFQTVKKTAADVGTVGKKAFGGFLEAIQVTRKDIVGVGDGIFDTIRNTNRFRDSLAAVKSAGDSLNDLPGRFSILSAQIESGTSALDRAAAGGSTLAQAFIPVTRVTEASRVELTGIERTLLVLTEAINRFTASTGGTTASLGLLNKSFNGPLNALEDLGKKLPEGSKAAKIFGDTFNEIQAKGDIPTLVKGILALKENASTITGPLGRIGQLFGIVDKESRDAAISLEKGLNRQLVDLGKGDVLTHLERLSVTFDSIKDKVNTATTTFRNFRDNLAKAIPGENIGTSIPRLLGDPATFNKIGVAIGTVTRIAKEAGIGVASAFDIIRAGAIETAGIFTKNFAPLGTLLKDIFQNTSLGQGITLFANQARDGFNKVSGFVNNLQDTVHTKLVGAFKTASSAVLDFFGAIGGQKSGNVFAVLGDQATKAGASINSGFSSVFKLLSSNFKAIIPDFSGTFDAIKTRALDAGTSLKNAFSGSDFGIGLKLFADSARSSFASVALQAAAVGEAIRGPLVEVFNQARASVSGFVEDFKKSDFGRTIVQSAKSAQAAITPIFSSIGKSISSALGNIGRPEFEPAASGPQKVAQKAAAAATTTAAEPIVAKAELIVEPTKITIRSVGVQALEPITAKAALIVEATSVVVQGIGAQALSEPIAISAPLTITPTSIDTKAVGAEVVNGLTTGIASQSGSVQSVLKTLAEAVLNGLRALFEIASPSKATTRMGRDIDQGLADGINQNKGVISSALNGLKGLLNGIAGPFKAVSDAAISVGRVGLAEVTAAAKITGTALAGLAGAAIITGANFNVLKQVISSTLPVIVGSKQVSDDLLASVNKLNDTSPFSRQTFIELTRVLAGFGVEAKKITPLIDSIQQAVAATGGSDADINELGQAFARLQSQGRLSLDIIQSFSSRGIDVISLLGQQFGKTQGQIRDMISNGLIPANQAIDALTKGLKEKFDGATESVSKNFPGALQRVQARLRDIGGDLDKAFINPAGGGALVDLLNNIATALAAVRNNLLPLIAGPLQALADQVSSISGAASNFVKDFANSFGTAAQASDRFGKSFDTAGITTFATSIKGLLVPALAGLIAVLPNLLTIIPVIGPLFEGFAAAVGGLPLVLTVLALSMKPVREAIVELGAAFLPVFKEVLPLASEAFKKLSDAVGPILGAVIKSFIPLVGLLGTALKEIFKALNPIIDAFKKIFDALKPVAFLVPVLVVAFNPILLVIPAAVIALKLLSPVIVFLAEVIAALIRQLTPGIVAIKDFVLAVVQSQQVKDIFNAIGETIKTVFSDVSGAIDFAVDKINSLIRIFNSLPGFLRGGIKIPVIGGDTNEATKAIDATKNATKELNKELKATAEAATKAALKTKDDFGAAKKASEDAAAAVSNLTDQLTQALSSTDQKLNGVLDAGKAVQTAIQAQKDAATSASKAQQELQQDLKDQAKALRDVISPANELAKAQRDLAKTGVDIVKNDQERVDLLREIADLQGQVADDKRAELDRQITRAQIALNKAKQDELDLTKQSNAANDTSVNLAGLSLDQIRSKLNNTRLSLQAQKQSTAETKTQGKTQQAIDDEKKTAALDVADAEQALKDAQKARQQFEVDTTRQIADDQQKIVDLQGAKIDLQLQQVEQQNHIIDLQHGETAQAAVIKDFNEKIKAARDANAKAQKAVTDAVRATALAEADLELKSAALRGDAEGQAAAQEKIWSLKKEGVTFDQATEASLKAQLGTINTILAQLNAAKGVAATAAAEAQRAALSQLGGFGTQEDAIRRQLNAPGAVFDPALTKVINDLVNNIRGAIQTINTGGQILNAQNQAVVLGPDQLNEVIAGIADEQAFHPDETFHDILVEILKKIGLHIPGFAVGYAPGQPLFHPGMQDGVGLARMFEFGKEAVLPLTDRLNMKRVVNNPNVLPEILDALPRITLPASGGHEAAATLTDISKAPRFAASPSGGTNASGQPMTYQDRRREQMQMADDIGEAVKAGMAEALKDMNLGNDIDINMAPGSNNDTVIAREVARQVKKALEKW